MDGLSKTQVKKGGSKKKKKKRNNKVNESKRDEVQSNILDESIEIDLEQLEIK